jgi:hypothetical protein
MSFRTSSVKLLAVGSKRSRTRVTPITDPHLTSNLVGPMDFEPYIMFTVSLFQ